MRDGRRKEGRKEEAIKIAKLEKKNTKEKWKKAFKKKWLSKKRWGIWKESGI